MKRTTILVWMLWSLALGLLLREGGSPAKPTRLIYTLTDPSAIHSLMASIPQFFPKR